MKVYETSQIRNVVLLGHGGSGKTTIAEAMAFVSGAITKMGSVTAGNTISDYDKEEQKRGFSISTSLIPIEYTDKDNGPVKLNILDTPGYFDFVGEVEEAVSAADAAVIVINCKAGIEPGTIKAWELCELNRLPRIIFVTNMDDDKASYRELILKLQARFGKKVAPLHLPIRENEKFVGFVNITKMKGRRFVNGGSKYEDGDIPESVQHDLEIARETLMEAVAEYNEEYMERYFSGDQFTEEEIYTALREQVRTCDLVPVFRDGPFAFGPLPDQLQDIVRVGHEVFPVPDDPVEICLGDLVLLSEEASARVFLRGSLVQSSQGLVEGIRCLFKLCPRPVRVHVYELRVVYGINPHLHGPGLLQGFEDGFPVLFRSDDGKLLHFHNSHRITCFVPAPPL